MELQIKDTNGWLKAPEGAAVIGIQAHGSFLVLRYSKKLAEYKQENTQIYLNSDGREVLRVTEFAERGPMPLPKIQKPVLMWYQKFWHWVID